MSVYEKVKLEIARRNIEMAQELETRRRTFDMIFAKIVPRLENYFNKECDSLIRDGGRANVSSVLESPLRSMTTFTFGLPYEGPGVAPLHTYKITVEADRLCTAEGRLFIKGVNPQAGAKPPGEVAFQEELGSVDAADFLIKMDKSFTKLLELVMHA